MGSCCSRPDVPAAQALGSCGNRSEPGDASKAEPREYRNCCAGAHATEQGPVGAEAWAAGRGEPPARGTAPGGSRRGAGSRPGLCAREARGGLASRRSDS